MMSVRCFEGMGGDQLPLVYNGGQAMVPARATFFCFSFVFLFLSSFF